MRSEGRQPGNKRDAVHKRPSGKSKSRFPEADFGPERTRIAIWSFAIRLLAKCILPLVPLGRLTLWLVRFGRYDAFRSKLGRYARGNCAGVKIQRKTIPHASFS